MAIWKVLLTWLALGCATAPPRYDSCKSSPCVDVLTLRGDINTAAAVKLKVELQVIRGDAVVLLIDSDGGRVSDAEIMIAAIQGVPTLYCVGLQAMSAAFWIFESCPHRILLDKSELMTHEVYYDLRSSVPEDMKVLGAARLRALAVELEATTTEMAAAQARRMGIPLARMLVLMHASWSPPPAEALAMGAADVVVQDFPTALTYVRANFRKDP